MSWTWLSDFHFHFWDSLVAQLVKNPPAMWETWVPSLGCEDPLEKGTVAHSSILAWRIPWTIQFHGVTESDMTEWLSLSALIMWIFSSCLFIKHLQLAFHFLLCFSSLVLWFKKNCEPIEPICPNILWITESQQWIRKCLYLRGHYVVHYLEDRWWQQQILRKDLCRPNVSEMWKKTRV